MKRTYNKNILLLFAVVSLIACKREWLNQKPEKNLTVPESLADFEALLDNESMNRAPAQVTSEIASDGHYILESRWQGAMADIERNAYTWSNDWPYRDLNEWNFSYEIVLYCNLILEGLQKIRPSGEAEQEQFNRIQGGALFQRARIFYELAQVYAPVYTESTASTDLGVPMRRESDVNIPSTRLSVKQNYDQIIADLNAASGLLPDISPYKTRASKAAVYGLLARVFLSMQDYDNAGEQADKCLQLYNDLMDYNQLSQSATFIGRDNPEVIFHCQSHNRGSITTAGFIDPLLYQSYDDNDLRRTVFCRVNANGTINFKGNYNRVTTLLFFGLATDELYLIRAESKARAGDKDGALDDLNTLLKSRWNNEVTFTPLSATSSEEALQFVLIEREKELLFRGLRWTDLRRLNKEGRFKKDLTRTIGGQIYTLEANSYKYTFPIPDDVIEKSGLQQNVGWE